MKYISLLIASIFFSCKTSENSNTNQSKNIPQGMQFLKSESRFNELIEDLQSRYSDIFKKQGYDFKITKHWNNQRSNGGSAVRNGQSIDLQMTGGLPQNWNFTEDAFILIACHEIGHILAGFPYTSQTSNEGQSDYYSAHACVRFLWKDDDNSKYLINEQGNEHDLIPAAKKCNQHWGTLQERGLCHRIVRSALNLHIAFFETSDEPGKQESPPTYKKFDSSVVESTSDKHPDSQCRIDTILEAALCKKEFDLYTTPAANFNIIGLDTFEAQEEAFKYSCTEGVGSRSKCWFAAHPVDPKKWTANPNSLFLKQCRNPANSEEQLFFDNLKDNIKMNTLKMAYDAPPLSCERLYFEMTHRKNLSISLTTNMLQYLKEFVHIKSISISNSCLEDLTTLNVFSLQRLNINGNICEKFDLSQIKSNTLKNLTLENIRMKETDLVHLKYFPSIFGLSLKNTGLSDISAIKALKNLNFLDLMQNNITDISALSALSNLEYINLYKNPIENSKNSSNCPTGTAVNEAINRYCKVN